MLDPIINIEDTECRTHKLVDALGREREIATGKCPCCRGGLFVILKGVLGMHMTHTEALYLVEALRQGLSFQLLKPSPVRADRKFVTQNLSGGRWLLAYGPDGVADFLCTGAPLQASSLAGSAVAFTPEQREAFADILFADLMQHATAVARA